MMIVVIAMMGVVVRHMMIGVMLRRMIRMRLVMLAAVMLAAASMVPAATRVMPAAAVTTTAVTAAAMRGRDRCRHERIHGDRRQSDDATIQRTQVNHRNSPEVMSKSPQQTGPNPQRRAPPVMEI
jgi:hypothetical protein